MYFDVREYLSNGGNEDDVIALVKSGLGQSLTEKTVSFRNEYVNFYGHATEKTVNHLAEELGMGKGIKDK